VRRLADRDITSSCFCRGMATGENDGPAA